MSSQPADALVLNPDELGPDPVPGMDLAVKLGVGQLEIRSAEGANALTLSDERLRHLRGLTDERGLTVAVLASPLWKWCRPEAWPGRVDTFGFPTQVPPEQRLRWIERAVKTARILGAPVVRVFSHLRVAPELTGRFAGDPLVNEDRLTYGGLLGFSEYLVHPDRIAVRTHGQRVPSACLPIRPPPVDRSQ